MIQVQVQFDYEGQVVNIYTLHDTVYLGIKPAMFWISWTEEVIYVQGNTGIYKYTNDMPQCLPLNV